MFKTILLKTYTQKYRYFSSGIYARVCISFLILESNLKLNLGCQKIFVIGFYLLFHPGIYLQIE